MKKKFKKKKKTSSTLIKSFTTHNSTGSLVLLKLFVQCLSIIRSGNFLSQMDECTMKSVVCYNKILIAGRFVLFFVIAN